MDDVQHSGDDAIRLTARQQEIVQYLRLGCTNQEISQYLNISVNTVKTHIATLYRELGAGNRTEAVHMLSQIFPAPHAETSSQPVWSREPPTVAVLPFGAPAGTPAQLSEATLLTEAVSLQLSRWQRFELIGHEACQSSQFVDLHELHKKIGAHYAVSASLRDDNGAWLSVRLLSAAQGQLRWAQDFKLSDELPCHNHDAVSAHLGAVLTASILKAEGLRVANLSNDQLQPWEKVTRGLLLLEARTAPECGMAIQLFTSVLNDDRANVPAHYGLVVASYLSVLEQWVEPTDHARKCVYEHARICVQLARDSHDTSLAMALSHVLDARLEDAIDLLLESVSANPGASSAFSLLGQLHAMLGRTELACRYLEECVRLSVYTPAYLRSQISLAMLCFVLGDYVGVVAACRNGLLYDTGYVGFHALLASASAWIALSRGWRTPSGE